MLRVRLQAPVLLEEGAQRLAQLNIPLRAAARQKLRPHVEGLAEQLGPDLVGEKRAIGRRSGKIKAIGILLFLCFDDVHLRGFAGQRLQGVDVVAAAVP